MQNQRKADENGRLAEKEKLARLVADKRASSIAFQRGLSLGEQGSAMEAAAWFVRAAELAPAGAPELREAAMLSAAYWRERQPTLQMALPTEHATNAVEFHPDHKHLFTAHTNGELKIWNIDTGRNTASYKVADVINRLAVSPDRLTLYVGDDKGLIHRWSISPDGQMVALPKWRQHTSGVASIEVSSDGSKVASCSQMGEILIRDAKTEEIYVRFSPHGRMQAGRVVFSSRMVHAVTFNRSADLIATCGSDSTARVWKVNSTKNAKSLEEVLRLVHNHEVVWSATFVGDDEQQLITGDMGGAVTVWDRTGRPRELGGKPRQCIQTLAVRPSGEMLLVASSDEVQVRTVDNLNRIMAPLVHPRPIQSAKWHPDGERFVTASNDGVRLWMMPRPAIIHSLLPKDPQLTQEGITRGGTASSENGEFHALGELGKRGRIWLWRLVDGKVDRLMPPPPQDVPVSCLAFNRNGTCVLIGRGDGEIRLWDVQSNRMLAQYPAGLNSSVAFVKSACFSPDGSRWAAGLVDGSIRLGSVASKDSVQLLKHQDDAIWSLAFSPDGRSLLSGSANGHICWWNTATAKLVEPIRSHGAGVHALLFTPDGRMVLSGGDGPVIRLWDAETHRDTEVTIRHDEPISELMWGKHGQLLFANQYANQIACWHWPTRQRIGSSIYGGRFGFLEARITADSTQLITYSTPASLLVWSLPPAPSEIRQMRKSTCLATGMEVTESDELKIMTCKEWWNSYQTGLSKADKN